MVIGCVRSHDLVTTQCRNMLCCASLHRSLLILILILFLSPDRSVPPHYALSSTTAGFMTELGFIGENCELWVVELEAAFMSVTSRFSGSVKKA